MGISRDVEVCSYQTVRISNEDIVKDLDKEDALEVIKGLLKKYSDLTGYIPLHLKKGTNEGKIFPKHLSDDLIKKYQSENKNIENFMKMEE